MLPEDDRVIETCRSILSILMQIFNFLNNIQGVPPPTKPGSSLIILPLMRILQRNLKRTYIIV